VDAATNKRIEELTKLIATEPDPEKLSKLVAELNGLLNEQKPPLPKEMKASEPKCSTN
jgi:hypothetical protein